MKEAEKDKPIYTTPEGAWEGGVINERKNRIRHQNPNDITTDYQGNGYPVDRVEQDD